MKYYIFIYNNFVTRVLFLRKMDTCGSIAYTPKRWVNKRSNMLSKIRVDVNK